MLDTYYFVPLATLLGLLVGSFLNVVVHRLPRMLERDWRAQCAELRGESPPDEPPLNLWVPRSRCPHCGHAIAWHENIPLFSFILQRGKCTACGGAIAWRYPVMELAAGLLAGYAAWRFGYTWQAGLAMALAWSLLVLTAIDLETYLLPDSITLPLLWLGLLANLYGLYTSLETAVLGAMAGYLVLWAVYHLFRLLTGKEGMGYGDFKLLAALGAWFGWTLLPLIIVASSLVGAVVGIAMILFLGHDRAKPIPFGPYLAMGGMVALFWGNELMRLYLG